MTTDDKRRTGSDAYDPLLTPGMIWRGKWILLLSLVIAAGGGLAYLRYAAQDSYEATSRLVVERQRVSIQPGSADGNQSLSLMTQVEVIRSPLILAPALQSAGMPTPDGLSDNQWIDQILGDLSVGVVENTNVISIGYRAPDPEQAARFVTALVDSYTAFVEKDSRQTRTTVQNALALREKSLSQRESKLQDNLQRLYDHYQALRTSNSRVAEAFPAVPPADDSRSASGIEPADGTEYTSSIAPAGGLPGRGEAAFASVTDRFADPASLAPSPLFPRDATIARHGQDASAGPLESHRAGWLNQPGYGADNQRARVLDQLLLARMREAQLLKSRGPKHADVTAVRGQIAVLNSILEQTDDHVEAAALLANIQRVEALWDSTFQQLREVQAANEIALASQPKIAIQNLRVGEVPVRLAWPRPLPFLVICAIAGLLLGCGIIAATDRLPRARREQPTG